MVSTIPAQDISESAKEKSWEKMPMRSTAGTTEASLRTKGIAEPLLPQDKFVEAMQRHQDNNRSTKSEIRTIQMTKNMLKC